MLEAASEAPLAVGRDFDDALVLAVRLLAQREHGRVELRTKLAARGVDGGVAERVVAKLQAGGQQSEERFAAALVSRRIARGYGPVYIRGELRSRRVDDEVADAAMSGTDEFWLDLAGEALVKKYSRSAPSGGDYNTQARFLARRGFPADIVYRALDSVRKAG